MRALVIGILYLALPASANAYFDPGTGSIIIQALIGALAAVTVFWGQLKTYVRSLFSSQSNKATSSSGSTDDLKNDSEESDELQ